MEHIEGKRQTLQQQAMHRAIEHVSQLLDGSDETKSAYRGLSHQLPILVRSSGLCQTLAFVYAKAEVQVDGSCVPTASNPLQTAYCRLWNHLTETLDRKPATLLNEVSTCDNLEYLRLSRKVERDWVFYKRFADSMLKELATSTTPDEDVDEADGIETS